MKRCAVLLFFALGACSTTVPVTQRFPPPPTDIVEPEPLDTLKAGASLTDLLHAVNQNNTRYHINASRLRSWNEWYKKMSDSFAK